MFHFGKKKAAAKPAAEQPAAPVAGDHDELVAKAGDLLAQAEGLAGEDAAKLLNHAGAALDAAGELDQAIDTYEKSFQAVHAMGDASKALQSLYNKKRQQLAKAGDTEGAMAYLGKMQGVMQEAKDQLRGK